MSRAIVWQQGCNKNTNWTIKSTLNLRTTDLEIRWAEYKDMNIHLKQKL